MVPWNKYKSSHRVTVIGEFENELGERYVIYCPDNSDMPYITGDEMAWQSPGVKLFVRGTLTKGFMFSEYERDQIAKIILPTLEGIMKEFTEFISKLSDDEKRALLKGGSKLW